MAKRGLGCLFMMLLFIQCEQHFFDEGPASSKQVFNAFWHELDRHYSFFSYTALNWDSLHAAYEPKVTVFTTEDELFSIFTEIADHLKDAHTNLFTPQGITGNIHYFDKYPANEIPLPDRYFDYIEVNRVYHHGTIKGTNIGYIKIRTFDGNAETFEKIDEVLDALKDTRGLIIDVRSNLGGFISNSELVAGRLAESKRSVARYRIRNGVHHHDFTNWIDVYVTPTKKGNSYQKPIVVLTNRTSYSATEWFVLMADALPHVSIVGDTTGGGSARPLLRNLPNGWLLRISNTQTLLPTGRDFQFTGIPPDYPVWIDSIDAAKEIDTILEKAITLIPEED